MEILNELFNNRCEYWLSIFETKCTNSLIYDIFNDNRESFIRLCNCFYKEPLVTAILALLGTIFGVVKVVDLKTIFGSKK
jgi:hypothetical protein